MKQVFEIAAIATKMGVQQLSTQQIRKQFVCDENPKEHIDHLVDQVLNKKTVYHLGEEESIITLAVAACEKALKKANLASDEIDGIIFTGITREFYSPTTALVLSHYLGCRNNLKCCIDSNADCIGLVTVMYQANAMMLADEEIQHLLLVDCGYLTPMNMIPNLVAATSSSDSATAIILSRRMVPAQMYFEGYQNAKQFNAAPGPQHGFTHFLRSKKFYDYGVSMNEDLDCEIELVINKIKSYLEEWQVGEIKAFCLSQYVYANILAIMDGLKLEQEVVPYIGDELGYTGPSSPFLALNAKLEKKELKAGDYIFLWTIATGSQHVFCSIKI